MEKDSSAADIREAENENGKQSNSKAGKASKPAVKIGSRASVACVKCRKRKIRCSGTYPSCDFCARKNIPCDYQGDHPAQNAPPASATIGTSGSPFSSTASTSGLPYQVPNPITAPPADILLAAYEAFCQNFEDAGLFNFFHRPSLRFELGRNGMPAEITFAMLSLAARFCPALVAFRPDAASAYFEASLSLTRETQDTYTIMRMQTLLMLSLYDCIDKSEKRGWALLGQAIRIGQILSLDNNQIKTPMCFGSRLNTGKQKAEDPRIAEEGRRTWWCAFLLESLLCDGQRQCSIRFDPYPIRLRLPMSNDDYYASRFVATAPFHTTLPPWAPPLGPDVRLETDLFGMTLRIADLYARVIAFVNAGGKNVDSRAPWDEKSTFHGLQEELTRWLRNLPQQYTNSPSTQMAHVLAGGDRLFGLMHVLYYTAVLYLHRDFLPFLPPSTWSPSQGPVDGPQLFFQPPPKPDHFWELSFTVMTDAAKHITDLACQIPSLSCNPFIGFALISASTVHAQLYWFPIRGFQFPAALQYCKQEALLLTTFTPYWPRIAGRWCQGIRKLFETYGLVHDARPPNDDQTSAVRDGVISLLQDKEEDDKQNGSEQLSNQDADYQHDIFALLHHDTTLTTPDPTLMFNLNDASAHSSLFPMDFDLNSVTFENMDSVFNDSLPHDWGNFQQAFAPAAGAGVNDENDSWLWNY